MDLHLSTNTFAQRKPELNRVFVRNIAALLLLVISTVGCASKPYEYGTGRAHLDNYHSPKMEQQFIYGKPHRLLDASDWIWPGSWLGKLFLWNRKIDSHEISPRTIEIMQQYIEANELDTVQVLVNSYNPGNQWQRLFKNDTVAPGWRYTLGIFSVINYTILPGRFFGGDAYNPYTNTIYLYSDAPAIALHEAGHAKDTGRRKYKGTHAAIYNLPGAPLYYEAKATNDALSYLRDRQETEQQQDGYKLLHPAYGTYVLGTFGQLLKLPVGISIAGAIPGHITGNIAASRVDDNEQSEKETGEKIHTDEKTTKQAQGN